VDKEPALESAPVAAPVPQTPVAGSGQA
jgi:hypothetical protein